MENKGLIISLIAVVVIAAAGVGIYAMNRDDNTSNSETTTTQTSENEQPAQSSQNIVDLAVATPQLSTLVKAVTEAQLVDTLSGDGPFTVLAPDDDAFAAALKALNISAEELLARDDLADILKYHVISGKVMSSDLSDGQVVDTVQGGKLTVDITDAGVFFVDANDGRAQVTTADVEASNGVVHIINGVLLP